MKPECSLRQDSGAQHPGPASSSSGRDVQIQAKDKTPPTLTLSTEPKRPCVLPQCSRPASKQGDRHLLLRCLQVSTHLLLSMSSTPIISQSLSHEWFHVCVHLVLTGAWKVCVTHPIPRWGTWGAKGLKTGTRSQRYQMVKQGPTDPHSASDFPTTSLCPGPHSQSSSLWACSSQRWTSPTKGGPEGGLPAADQLQPKKAVVRGLHGPPTPVAVDVLRLIPSGHSG